jgi:hypothetical protein
MLLYWGLGHRIVRYTSRVEHVNPQSLDVMGMETRRASQRRAKARNGSSLWVPACFVSQKGERNLMRIRRIRNSSRHATHYDTHQVRWIWEDMGNVIARFCACRVWLLVGMLRTLSNILRSICRDFNLHMLQLGKRQKSESRTT